MAKTSNLDHSLEITDFGPASKGALAEFTGQALQLQNLEDFSEKPSGESLISTDDYSVAWLPATPTDEGEELFAAGAKEAVARHSLCCGYAYIPCCWGRILVRICVSRPWVWYRICYICRYGNYYCRHCIYVLCRG